MGREILITTALHNFRVTRRKQRILHFQNILRLGQGLFFSLKYYTLSNSSVTWLEKVLNFDEKFSVKFVRPVPKM